jgi:hypothetical protein
LIFIILFQIILNLSCNNSDTNKTIDCSYKIFTTQDKEFSFLKIKNQPDIIFEYPGCYKLYYPGTPSNKNTMSFDFHKDLDKYLTNSMIQITIQKLDSTNIPINTSNRIDVFLTDTKNDSKFYDNFTIAERKSILINDVEGESATVLVHSKELTGYPAMDETLREVVFEQQGYLWIFLLHCNSKDIALNMPDFDHVLNTFKIL